MIMGPFTGVSSRITSNRPSGASSAVHDIMKKRDKPFKTETERVVAKKRKLHIRTAYKQAVPQGYKFLPVGTPDLAERCKEISRQKGCDVNVVNSKPATKNAEDPGKVSHHIARIGYHFRSDILDDACQQLGYIYYHGELVKAAELEAQQKAAQQQSILAQTLAKYGVDPSTMVKGQGHEDPISVKAAIKELFPRMPSYDLEQIMLHAWKKGSRRVGLNSQLDLPRRVQLATIARIRHEYTDYDRLLRAFTWFEARAIVEPDCLRKLIEWRGETEKEDDDQFEEIVRETIIIDDDDDDDDDADSVTDLDAGDTSDASVEITHHVVADMDFGAESHDDRPHRRVAPYRAPVQSLDQRNLLKQKIGNARQQLRAGVPSSHGPQPAVHTPIPPQNQNEVVRVVVQPDQFGTYPSEVMVGGQRMLVGRPQPSTPIAQPHLYQQPPQTPPVYGYTHAAAVPHLSTHSGYAHPAPTIRQDNQELYNRPVPSIEIDDSARRTALSSQQIFRPVTPDQEHIKRRRVDDHQPNRSMEHIDLTNEPDLHDQRRLPAQPEIMDLISPVRNSYVSHRSPFTYDARSAQNGQVQPQKPNIMWPVPIPPPGPASAPTHYSHQYGHARQPNVQYTQQVSPAYPVHGAPARVQQAPITRPPPSAHLAHQPLHNTPHPVQYASQSGIVNAQPQEQYHAVHELSYRQPPSQNGSNHNPLTGHYQQQDRYYHR
ncbi:hypothetical protein LTS14_002278 [Recurvomyces mirabilis]|uniref:uncharacterized protein n=1 Tax=Recurvomyces mirabilis TaxID=574656 RepID=UPI002DDE4F22|nr:hypothetical protein LTS14_002278 [Recurvomyces mirabilis]